MRSLLALAAILVVALAFGAPTASGQSICDKYAGALGLDQNTLLSALITRVVFGTNNAASTFGNVTGTFVALRANPTNQLDLVSTSNFATVSKTITLTTPSSDTLVGVARRPANGGYYFLGSSGQLYYNTTIDSFITNSLPAQATISVALTPIGSAVAARGGNGGAVGFNFNPVGDRIRITSTNQNFRINPDTGAAGNTGTATTSADGTDQGGFITYLGSAANSPSIVATAYTNLVAPSPRNATATFGTVQYGIDTANTNFVQFADSNAGTIVGSGIPLTGVNGPQLGSNVGLTVVSQAGGAGNVVVATIPTSAGSAAYTINPATGVATPVSGALSGNAYIGITFTTAVNNFGVMQPKNTVAGIAGVPSLLPYFNLGIIFKQGQQDYTQGAALTALATKLVQFFGNTDALDCTGVTRPSPSAPSQYVVHKNMNITQELFDAFNGQVASAASSFGVSDADVATVGGFLASFGKSTFNDDPAAGSKAICTQSNCACASGYNGTNCQTFTGTSASSSGTSTTSSGGQGNNGAAAGLTAPFLSLAALAVATMLAAMRA